MFLAEMVYMRTVREIFAHNLKALLDHHKWSNAYLAERLKTAPSNVSLWLQGKSFPRDEQIDKIAMEFGVDIADLFTVGKTAPMKEITVEQAMRLIAEKLNVDFRKGRKRHSEN